MIATKGRSLELYFVDGDPDGMLTAEVFNWTGHVLRIPRTQLAEGLKRDAAQQTGVYILLGQDENGPLAYVGETEVMSTRLKQHAKEKDWWDMAVLVTTHSDVLHKAHVRYLEKELYKAAQNAAHRTLANGNEPGGASLTEAASANMDSFLETLHMVFPAIKVDVFQSGKREIQDTKSPKTNSPLESEFIFEIPKHGIKAFAVLIDQELVVKSGSTLRADWVGDRKHKTNYWRLYDELVRKGIIEKTSQGAQFTADYAFSSPSAAAAVVSGRSANGRTSWKTLNGRTYAEWEAQQLEETLK